MRRFWSDLLASLYNIRDGIVQKKQELDEERAACEQEKEELRGQVADLEEELANSEESIVIEPIAVFQDDNGTKSLKPFNKNFIASNNLQLALYKTEDFEKGNVNNIVYLKDGKIYFLKSPFYLDSDPQTLRVENVLVGNEAYSEFTTVSYEAHLFIQNGRAYDYFDTKDYTINLENLQIDAEIEDLNDLWFIVSISME